MQTVEPDNWEEGEWWGTPTWKDPEIAVTNTYPMAMTTKYCMWVRNR